MVAMEGAVDDNVLLHVVENYVALAGCRRQH